MATVITAVIRLGDPRCQHGLLPLEMLCIRIRVDVGADAIWKRLKASVAIGDVHW